MSTRCASAGPRSRGRPCSIWLNDAGYDWLDRFHDQPFSLTDAVSFELMRRERVTHAFAFDPHFVTAGFELVP